MDIPCLEATRYFSVKLLEKLSQTKFIAGHGQSRASPPPVRRAWNRRQISRNPSLRPPKTEAAAARAAHRPMPGRPVERLQNNRCAEGGFRRGAGEAGDAQPFDGLPPAHSCRSHSFTRAGAAERCAGCRFGTGNSPPLLRCRQRPRVRVALTCSRSGRSRRPRRARAISSRTAITRRTIPSTGRRVPGPARGRKSSG